MISRLLLAAALALALAAACGALTQANDAAVYPAAGLHQDDLGLSQWSPSVDGRLRASVGNFSTSDWQGALLAIYPTFGDLTLKQMVLPGTHDSGAYALSNQIVPGIGSDFLDAVIEMAEAIGVRVQDIITPWALSQTIDLYEQALLGVRYFDLRICWNGSDFATAHFEIGNTIATLLTDVRRFLDEHPLEMVVIEGQLLQTANHTIPLDEKAALAAFILDTFDTMLYPESSAFEQTYQQLLANGARVLFTVDDADMYAAGRAASGAQLLWHGHSAIWNTYANTHDLDTMQAFNTKRIVDFNSNSSAVSGPAPPQCHRLALDGACLYKISWTLTTDAIAILSSLEPNRPRSLIEMADTANVQLSSFVSEGWIAEPGLQLGNILILDDFTHSPLIDIAIQQNVHAAEQPPLARMRAKAERGVRVVLVES